MCLIEIRTQEHRTRPGACRYIPLNSAGESVESLYRTGTQQELEAAVRTWLLATIQELEKSGAR